MEAVRFVFVCAVASALFGSGADGTHNRRSSSVSSHGQSNKWQTLLVTLQRNPALVQQLRSNPELVRKLKEGLLQHQKQQQQQLKRPQRQHQHQQLPRKSRNELHLTPTRLSPTPVVVGGGDQCSSLRIQNARLKQMIQAVLEEQDPVIGAESRSSNRFLSQALSQGHRVTSGQRNQRELNAAQLLLNRVAQDNRKDRHPVAAVPVVSLSSTLVTPTATWTTLVESSTYLTTVTEQLTTELPIILRGSKVVTTIIEPTVLTATATEMKTSSSLVTPTPTWSTATVTITSTAAPTPAVPVIPHPAEPILPSLWPQVDHPRRLVDPLTGLEHADVLEVGRGTSPSDAKAKLDRLKQAYGIFFTQQQQQQFGLRQQAANPNPIFAGKGGSSDYDYLDDFDQQVLAAQARPVFVKNPNSRADKEDQIKATPVLQQPQQQPPVQQEEEQQHQKRENAHVQEVAPPPIEPSVTEEVVTIYISGRVPGEYTTSLSTVTKTASADPSPKRSRREAPSRIATTALPDWAAAAADAELEEVEIDSLLSSILDVGGAVAPSSSQNVKTVTVTVTSCPSP